MGRNWSFTASHLCTTTFGLAPILFTGHINIVDRIIRHQNTVFNDRRGPIQADVRWICKEVRKWHDTMYHVSLMYYSICVLHATHGSIGERECSLQGQQRPHSSIECLSVRLEHSHCQLWSCSLIVAFVYPSCVGSEFLKLAEGGIYRTVGASR